MKTSVKLFICGLVAFAVITCGTALLVLIIEPSPKEFILGTILVWAFALAIGSWPVRKVNP